MVVYWCFTMVESNKKRVLWLSPKKRNPCLRSYFKNKSQIASNMTCFQKLNVQQTWPWIKTHSETPNRQKKQTKLSIYRHGLYPVMGSQRFVVLFPGQILTKFPFFFSQSFPANWLLQRLPRFGATPEDWGYQVMQCDVAKSQRLEVTNNTFKRVHLTIPKRSPKITRHYVYIMYAFLKYQHLPNNGCVSLQKNGVIIGIPYPSLSPQVILGRSRSTYLGKLESSRSTWITMYGVSKRRELVAIMCPNTDPETNIASENGWLRGNPFLFEQKSYFQRANSLLVFRGGYFWNHP